MIIKISRSIAVVLAVSLAALAQSQATTGTVQGIVTDPNGAVVSGATINLKNDATGFERTVTSNSEGFFSAPLLPLGRYRVTTDAGGFSRSILENVDVTIGQTLSLNIGMKVGSVTDTVDVSAEGDAVDIARTELSTQINQRSVENLPINRRDFSRFALLTPGVSIVQGPDGDEITINGQKGIQNNVSIDGSDANNPFFGEQRGGQRPAFTISLESVKEFQVVPVGASAEFGRSSGGFINVVTKSGTNTFSGAAFVFFRNKNLASQNKDAVAAGLPTEDFRNYQFGGNVGGPIKKDRAFFFVAYERNDGTSSKPNFIDPRLVDIFATRFNSPGEQGIIKRTNVADVFLGKVDIQINKNNLLTLRHNYSRAEQVNGTFDVPTWGTSANGRETDNSNSFIGQLVTNFSPTLLNEFRFQWAKENRPRFYDGPDLPDTTIGTFDGSISYRFGRPFFLPTPANDKRVQFTDNFTVIRGNHAIRFGADINRTRVAQTFIGFARGRYIFAGGTIDDAINGFIDYIDGVSPDALALYLQFAPVGDRTVEEAGTQAYTTWEPALYIQDNWQVKRNLTLNLGFRWEAQFEPDPINEPSATRYGQFVDDPNFPSDGTIPDFTKGFAPRFAVSWSPGDDGKTAIRVGAGIYYARIPGLVVAGPRNTDGAIASNIFFASFLCQGGGKTPQGGGGLNGCPIYPGIVPTAGFSPFNPGIAVFARDFTNPRTIQFSASVEREIYKNMSFLVAYNYAKTDHLTRFINRNDGRFAGGLAQDPGPFALPDGSGVGEIRSTESTARSLYNGITFTLNRRFADRFQFQVNYLLSWDKSDDDNERDPFTFRYADPRNLDPEWGYSDRDQRHRFNAFATFILPWDVNFSPIVQYRSAQPTSLVRVDGSGNAILVNGEIIPRNTERLHNEFFTFDVRLSKAFKFGERMELEGIFEAFNLFNNRNQHSLPRPLTFNFDGTVSAGFGEPRQAQLGLRFKF
jgi:hypothetical protein